MEDQLRLRMRVLKVNKEIFRNGLVIQTWGNASAINREINRILIKSSGVPFENLNPEDISEVDLDGNLYTVFKPSVDTPAHIEIYKGFMHVGGIVHTHSRHATVFAQAKIPIPCVGATHSDYFYGDIPVVNDLTDEEIENDYEKNIGKRIVQYFIENKIDPIKMPAALISSHGVFTWGENIERALEVAIVLEEVAIFAHETIMLAKLHGKELNMKRVLMEKHFERKNGRERYYGQG